MAALFLPNTVFVGQLAHVFLEVVVGLELLHPVGGGQLPQTLGELHLPALDLDLAGLRPQLFVGRPGDLGAGDPHQLQAQAVQPGLERLLQPVLQLDPAVGIAEQVLQRGGVGQVLRRVADFHGQDPAQLGIGEAGPVLEQVGQEFLRALGGKTDQRLGVDLQGHPFRRVQALDAQGQDHLPALRQHHGPLGRVEPPVQPVCHAVHVVPSRAEQVLVDPAVQQQGADPFVYGEAGGQQLLDVAHFHSLGKDVGLALPRSPATRLRVSGCSGFWQFQQKLDSLPTHLPQPGHFHQPPGAGAPHLLPARRAAFFTRFRQRGALRSCRAFSRASPVRASPVFGSIN